MQIYYLRVMRMFVLFVLILVGLTVGMLLIAVLSLFNGANLADIMNQDALMGKSPGFARILIFINHATMFLIPGIVWSIIYYKKNWKQGLSLHGPIKSIYFIAGIVFLIVAYPLVSKSMEINQSINLPAWMGAMEDQTMTVLKNILTMNSIVALLANLLVIAILPGIGEELIFRGIIQKELASQLKNPYVTVVVSAIIFSALHFQFEGFLPRFLLGMILGLIYYWTNSLWVSMAVHAFNNGIQVLITYFYPEMIDRDMESSVPVTWYILLISGALTTMIALWFHQQGGHDRTEVVELFESTNPSDL